MIDDEGLSHYNVPTASVFILRSLVIRHAFVSDQLDARGTRDE